MARIEADREDLFEEFRSAKVKWELQIPGFDTEVILGIRRDDRLSVYFGPDPCYHYDAQCRLLRAFAKGVLYRTQGKTLARLTRERTSETTTLLRHDLSPEELKEFLLVMRTKILHLSNALNDGTQTLIRSNSNEQQLIIIRNRLAEILSSTTPPLAPPFPTRKA